MTDLFERLVPDELWVLFRRVVPQWRAGDREALATIIFVATVSSPSGAGDRVWAMLYA